MCVCTIDMFARDTIHLQMDIPLHSLVDLEQDTPCTTSPNVITIDTSSLSMRANSICQESIYWSAIFENLLAYQEQVKAYNLSKMGIRDIDDVVDDQG